jgi:hypothetical protein
MPVPHVLMRLNRKKIVRAALLATFGLDVALVCYLVLQRRPARSPASPGTSAAPGRPFLLDYGPGRGDGRDESALTGAAGGSAGRAPESQCMMFSAN